MKTSSYILFWAHAIEKKRESMHQCKIHSNTSKAECPDAACLQVHVYFSGPKCPFGGLGDGPGRPSGWGPPLRPATRVPRVLGEPSRGTSSRVIISSLRLEKLDRAAARALGSRAPGAPRPHHLGAGMCALRATSVPPGRAAREAPCTEPPRGGRAPAGGGTLAGTLSGL